VLTISVNQLSPWKSTRQSSYSPTTINKNEVCIITFKTSDYSETYKEQRVSLLHTVIKIKALMKVKSNTWQVSTSTKDEFAQNILLLKRKGFYKMTSHITRIWVNHQTINSISSSWDLHEYKGSYWFVPWPGNRHLAYDLLFSSRSSKQIPSCTLNAGTVTSWHIPQVFTFAANPNWCNTAHDTHSRIKINNAMPPTQNKFTLVTNCINLMHSQWQTRNTWGKKHHWLSTLQVKNTLEISIIVLYVVPYEIQWSKTGSIIRKMCCL
jgi:hypothetical protein